MRKLKKYKPTKFMAKTSHYDKDAADYAVMFIESLCHTKGTWAGKPFELIDWQEQIIRDLFGVLKPNGYAAVGGHAETNRINHGNWRLPCGAAAFFHTQKLGNGGINMKELWNTAQVIFAAIGGWLGYFLGGCDGLLIALVVFVAVDYITGVMCAVSDKKLSSEVGFKGICRKVLIFLLVGIANIVDVQVIGTGSVLRTAVIFFYLSNEGVSLLENAAHLGLPVPEKMKDILAHLHDRAENTESEGK